MNWNITWNSPRSHHHSKHKDPLSLQSQGADERPKENSFFSPTSRACSLKRKPPLEFVFRLGGLVFSIFFLLFHIPDYCSHEWTPFSDCFKSEANSIYLNMISRVSSPGLGTTGPVVRSRETLGWVSEVVCVFEGLALRS